MVVDVWLIMYRHLMVFVQVEIRCMGEVVIPTLKLQKLVDLWLHRSSNRQKIDAWIGSSAKDYMMVLAYGRKLPECNNTQRTSKTLSARRRFCGDRVVFVFPPYGISVSITRKNII